MGSLRVIVCTMLLKRALSCIGLAMAAAIDCSTSDTNLDALSKQVAAAEGDFAKYAIMSEVQADCSDMYYQALAKYTQQLLPVVYTPAVGAGCWDYGALTKTRPGLIITPSDRGKVSEKLAAWTAGKNIDVIVATDGERILGLGDLGRWGMGIPVGKLALYSALGGVAPSSTLPITIDVGTNTQRLKDDPDYDGIKADRVRGPEYHALLEELVEAIKTVQPTALLQFEDFGKTNAFDLLERHAGSLPSFNDDVQGTAAVTVAGIKAAMSLTHERRLHKGTYLFLGAGQAGTGIGELLVHGMMNEENVESAVAYRRVYLMDSKGLITDDRLDPAKSDPKRPLDSQKRPFAHPLPEGVDPERLKDLAHLVRTIKPTHLIGVSGRPATFTKEVIEAMTEVNKDGPPPVIFALSNPTSKSECTAQQAYDWSGGRAIFASGSPFPVTTAPDGSKRRPGQANNCYIFPGVGLGVGLSGAKSVTQEMIMSAANAVSTLATSQDLSEGCLFPTLAGGGRSVAAHVAAAVAVTAHASQQARKPRPDNMLLAAYKYMHDYDAIKAAGLVDIPDERGTEL